MLHDLLEPIHKTFFPIPLETAVSPQNDKPKCLHFLKWNNNLVMIVFSKSWFSLLPSVKYGYKNSEKAGFSVHSFWDIKTKYTVYY